MKLKSNILKINKLNQFSKLVLKGIGTIICEDFPNYPCSYLTMYECVNYGSYEIFEINWDYPMNCFNFNVPIKSFVPKRSNYLINKGLDLISNGNKLTSGGRVNQVSNLYSNGYQLSNSKYLSDYRCEIPIQIYQEKVVHYERC